MTSSFAISLAFLCLHRYGIVLGTHRELLLSVAFTSFCWILTAFVGPETDHATLISFLQESPSARAGLDPDPRGSGRASSRSREVCP